MFTLTDWKVRDANVQIDSSSERAGSLGIFNSVLGHVGDGNFHQILIYNPDKADQRDAVEKCVDTMMVEALKMGGTISVSNQNSIVGQELNH